MLALVKNNVFVKTAIEEDRVVVDKITFMPAKNGQAFGEYSLHTILPAPPVPNGKKVIGTSIEKVGNSWAYVDVLADVVPPAIDEIRAAMPPKTPREFRDILVDLGLKISDITTAINSIPFEKERAYALNAWEVMTVATRTDPYIDMIGAMFNITPTEIDYAWLHGAAD